MNMLQAKGNWNVVKGRVRQVIAGLLRDEQQFTLGKENELIGRIQKKTGDAMEKNEGINSL